MKFANSSVYLTFYLSECFCFDPAKIAKWSSSPLLNLVIYFCFLNRVSQYLLYPQSHSIKNLGLKPSRNSSGQAPLDCSIFQITHTKAVSPSRESSFVEADLNGILEDNRHNLFL